MRHLASRLEAYPAGPTSQFGVGRAGENAYDKDRDTHDKNAEGEPQEGEAKWREVAGERNCKEKQHPSVERVA
jgi:hypothetical protein